MLHDGSAVVEGLKFSSLETPKAPFFPSPLSSSFVPHSNTTNTNNVLSAAPAIMNGTAAIEWDWGLEHADRKRETKADSAVHGAPPFHVDRNILRDVIKEKMDCRVGRIEFLNSGA
jgi:hypothetical protein